MISKAQQLIRRWFQRHGWHTNSTPTKHGAWLWAPVQTTGYYGRFIPFHGCTHCRKESKPSIEIDRFGEEKIYFTLEQRIIYEDVSENVLTDEQKKQQEWQKTGHFYLTFQEVKKLAELVDATSKEYETFRKKHHLPKKEKLEELNISDT